ncbi:MAG: DUF3565 domain-containing protein [Candidatus Promineofilum sp.]|nr:DUF3565 domain-containing protein [Promineifilum sp.]
MERAIVGFDQDELGDWRAILACGHRQHVRHNPPLVERPWVLTEEGRSRFLGVALECKACDEGEPVSDAMITPDALEAVYRQFHTDLVRFIRPRVADPGMVEGIVQDVCFHIHAQASDLDESDHLASWLSQIVHKVIDNRDRHADQPADLSTADDREAAAPLAEAVKGLVACLPGSYRQAVVMAEYQGLRPPAMAERLDISPSEAEARVRRGREMLNEALLDWCHFEAERQGWVLPRRSAQ